MMPQKRCRNLNSHARRRRCVTETVLFLVYKLIFLDLEAFDESHVCEQTS
jgi:hypothetical protein